MPFKPCTLGIETLPFYVQYLSHVSVQYLPQVCQLDETLTLTEWSWG